MNAPIIIRWKESNDEISVVSQFEVVVAAV